MTGTRSIAFALALGSGIACGSVKPLGTAQPRPEPGPDAADEMATSPEPDTIAAEMAAEMAAQSAAWATSGDPLYVVTTRVKTTGNLYQSFLLTVPEIGPGTSFGLEQAVEIDSDSGAFGTLGKPYVYAASAATPTVARWRLTAEGSIEEGAQLSFESVGMRRADSAGSLSFYAEDKAYFCNQFDPSNVVIWDPQTMSIRGTIPLELPVQGRMKPQVVLSQRADRLFAIASWQDTFAGDWTHFGDHVQVISIDPSTDSVVGRVDEPRCNSFSCVSAASDGTAYFSAASYFAPLRPLLGAPSGVEACALRIMPGADRFEAGYGVDLDALTGGRPAGDLFLVSDTTAFLRVWHSELVTPLSSGNENWEAVLQEPGFLWWSWRVGSAEAQQVPDQRPSVNAQVLVVDGKAYTPTLSEDGLSSALQELEPAGELRAGLTGPGQIVGVFRVR